MQPVDIQALGALKARVDAGDGPDLLLDREIDLRLRGGKPFKLPWTSTVEASLTLFVELGIKPAEILAQVCRHHEQLDGEPFISRLPRGIVSVGLGYLLEKSGSSA